jgi:hypothetical protein
MPSKFACNFFSRKPERRISRPPADRQDSTYVARDPELEVGRYVCVQL